MKKSYKLIRGRCRTALAMAVILLIIHSCSTGPEMPKHVLEMQEKAQQLSVNEQGYWEAEFEDGHVMIYIPEGEFTMGSNDGLSNERPIHKVFLDGYWMAKYTVTVAQFRHFIEDTGYITDAERGIGSWQYVGGNPSEGDPWEVVLDGCWHNPYFEQEDNHPAVSMSWNDSIEFCKWLSNRIGVEFKLPTEAQWMKAARGTDERIYPWGNEPPDGTKANYADMTYFRKYGNARRPDSTINDGYVETAPVGSYPAGASPYGVMDMAGNVWEWGHDVFERKGSAQICDYYANSPYKNPIGAHPGENTNPDRMELGGSWNDWAGYLNPEGGHNLRAPARTGVEQNSADDHSGIRIAIDYIKRAY